MKTIKVTFEDIEESEFLLDKYDEFIDMLRSSDSKSSAKPESSIKIFIEYGFFAKKARTEEDIMLKKRYKENKTDMFFDERLENELEKVRMNLIIKAGNFIIGDRIDKESDLPEIVEKFVGEDIKIKMIFEQMSRGKNRDKDILDSIPNLSEEILGKEYIKMINREAAMTYKLNLKKSKKSKNSDGTDKEMNIFSDELNDAIEELEESLKKNSNDNDDEIEDNRQKRNRRKRRTDFDIDEILDKIKEEGSESLSDDEKGYLDEYSSKL